MKTSYLQWAKCPYCMIELNGWEFYPASILMDGHDYHVLSECPSCFKRIAVHAKVEIKISAIKAETSTPESERGGEG
jgi:hypothetical protein